MGTDNFKNIFFGIIFVTLFSMLVVNFAVRGAETYNVDTDDLALKLNQTGMENIIFDSQNQMQKQQSSFSNQTYSVGTGEIEVKGIFDIMINIFEFIVAPFVILLYIMGDILHIPYVGPILTTAIIAGLIFGVWSLIKKGD